MQYNKQYNHIRKDVIDAVKKTIFEHRIFKKSNSFPKRYLILCVLRKRLCNIYNIKHKDIPRIDITTQNEGFYSHIENIIFLSDKLSLVTFLHEFKHFLQFKQHKQNSEKIARGYSLSLFYLASAKHFKRAVRKGLIPHQKEL